MIDQILVNHAELFPEHKHRMLVAEKLYDQVYLQLSDYWKRESFIPHSSSTFWQQAKWAWLNKPLAEEYWDEVDIVYCPAESYVSTQKAKLVCTIHDVAGFENDLYDLSQGIQWHRRKWRVLFQQMERHADSIVTVSNFSAERIAHFFPGLEKKLKVIYNAPHSIFGSHVDELQRDEVKRISKDSPFILVPGGLSLRKNGGLILDAIPHLARQMPEVKLIIAGSNATAYLNRLNSIDCANVVLAGYVSDALLNALYHEAAAVWFPSRYEGFGMPVIEAMATGAQVVASNAASVPEVAGGVATLCDMDNASEHVEALRSLVGAGQSRNEKYRERSLQQAAQFTWKSSAQNLEAIFQSLYI